MLVWYLVVGQENMLEEKQYNVRETVFCMTHNMNFYVANTSSYVLVAQKCGARIFYISAPPTAFVDVLVAIIKTNHSNMSSILDLDVN